MTLYAALLYYPADSYWASPEETSDSADYGVFGAAAGAAGVLRGGEALHPAEMATTLRFSAGKDSATWSSPTARTRRRRRSSAAST